MNYDVVHNLDMTALKQHVTLSSTITSIIMISLLFMIFRNLIYHSSYSAEL